MRGSGLMDRPSGMRGGDHACWMYDGADEFTTMARDYLAEGLRAGQRIAFIGSRSLDELASDLAPLGDVDALVAGGSLQLASSSDMYPGGETFAPEAQVDTFRRISRQAAADGYTGYRVVADITPLLTSDAQLEALKRYEHLADRLIVAEQITGMCAYDRSALDEEAMELMGCLHPQSAGVDPAFRLYTKAPGTLALEGELDVLGVPKLREALDVIPERGVDLTVDLSGLRFVDHRSLCALAEWASDAGVSLTLTGSAPVVERLRAWLGLQALRVEVAA